MTSQQFLVCDSSTLANFKQWAQAISTFMSTIGWTQTADTGQVNWSTIASVPTAGTFVYEIWQPSSDPLQTGSTAYYLKIQYGQTSQTPPGIRIALQAGTGTNGSGTLTGLTTAVDDPLGNGAVGGGSVGYECDFSGDAERVSICMFRTTPTGTLPFYFSVERTKNTDGSNSSDGVTLLNAANSAGTNQGLQVIVFGQAVTAATGRVLPILSGSNSADQFLNSIPAGPLFPDYGKFGNPITNLVGVPSGLITTGIIFQIQLYGATRTYLCIGSAALLSPNSTAMAMRYD